MDPDYVTDEDVFNHEMGHVFGLLHEHQRYDRDSCVRVRRSGSNYNKISRLRRHRFLFWTWYDENSRTFSTPYDYHSIMHYPEGSGITLRSSDRSWDVYDHNNTEWAHVNGALGSRRGTSIRLRKSTTYLLMQDRILHRRRRIHRASRMGWQGQDKFVRVLLVAAAVLSGYSVVACRMGQPTVDYFTEYDLEIVNRAPESVRIIIHIGGQDFKDVTTGVRIRSGGGSGIVSLKIGEIRMFEMSLFGGRIDSFEDNDLVRYFRRIEFLEENSDGSYKSYDYPFAGCHDVPPGSDCSDDMWISYTRSDGPGERLFVRSSDRPFYLERDGEDLDLGRIVITFVPDAATSTVAAAN